MPGGAPLAEESGQADLATTELDVAGAAPVVAVGLLSSLDLREDLLGDDPCRSLGEHAGLRYGPR
jgi:hypothetical protein